MIESSGTYDPLARARERWRRYAVAEYGKPGNLTLSQASDYARQSPETIRERQGASRLYALPDPGRTGEWRYPQWQFHAPPSRLTSVLQVFSECNRWVLHSFLLRGREVLNSRSPAEVIVDETDDLQPVVNLALIERKGEQGAT